MAIGFFIKELRITCASHFTGGIYMSDTVVAKKWFERIKVPHTYVILISILTASSITQLLYASL